MGGRPDWPARRRGAPDRAPAGAREVFGGDGRGRERSECRRSAGRARDVDEAQARRRGDRGRGGGGHGRGEVRTLAAGGALRIVRTTDGRFRFDALARGAAVAIAAVHPVEGIAPATGMKLSADGREAPLELTLVPGVVFVGAVVDEQGVPLANAQVDVNRFEGDEHNSSTSSLSGATTDAEGRYRTAPFPYRSFELIAHATGFLTGDFGRVVVPEAEREHVADFKLVRASTWRGKVVTADGAPARLARVQGELVVADTRCDPHGHANSFDAGGHRGRLLLDEDRYEITPSDARARFVGIWCDATLLGAAELGDPDHAPDLVVDL